MRLILLISLVLSTTSFFSFAQSLSIAELQQLTFEELDSLVMIPYQTGHLEQCIPYMQAGLEKAKLDSGKISTIYSEYANNLGFFYSELGYNKKAETYFLETMEIRKKLLGVEHPKYAAVLNNLAAHYSDFGDYPKAEPLYLKSKTIREKSFGKESSQYIESVNNLAQLYWLTHHYNLSEQLYLEAQALIKKRLKGNTNHPQYVQNLNNMAALYVDMDKQETAESMMLEVLDIYAAVIGKQHPSYARGLNNLASLYYKMGDYKKAAPLYIEAISIIEATLGTQHPRYATNINNLANVYKYMSSYPEAEELYLKSLALLTQSVPAQHPDYILCLNNISNLYIRQGRYDLARTYIQQIISLTTHQEMSIQITEAWKDSLLEVTYDSPRHIELLIACFANTYELIQKDKDSNLKQQQFILFDLISGLLKKSRNRHISEKDKLHILSLSHKWMLRSLKNLDISTDVQKIFEIAEQNKGILLLESSKSAQTYQMGNLPDSLIAQEKELLDQYSQMEARLVEDRSTEEKDSIRTLLNKLSADMLQLTKNIKTNYPKYTRLKQQQFNLELSTVQDLLEPKSALLEYLITDSMSYIFYIDQETIKITPIDVPNEDIKRRIKLLHYALSDYELITRKSAAAYQMYSEQAYWFYTTLVAPALDPSKEIEQLIIIPDGELGNLPFEAFLVKEAPQGKAAYHQLHYLIRDYKISYNYSAILWKENKEQEKSNHNGQILGMAANYAIQLDSSKTENRLATHQKMRSFLDTLPAARQEVKALSERFKGYFAFDASASERIFKEKSADFAVIHLAMHGLLNTKDQILSSIAFTEDSDSMENNFLQAYEISKLDLKAELVILSACETGFGKFEQGNGIASLARAFMYAGAPAMIVSLWQVNDYATSTIMKNLYKKLADGMHKDKALQEAKLDYLASTEDILAHPAFWSPFILIGNEDPVTISRKGNLSFWLIPLGALLVLLVGLGVKRSKNKALA